MTEDVNTDNEKAADISEKETSQSIMEKMIREHFLFRKEVFAARILDEDFKKETDRFFDEAGKLKD